MTETLREAVARAIARGLGDEFSNAFRNKERWTAKRGMSGGRFRDVNEPFQSDYLAAADAAIRTVLERLREPSEAMLAAAVPEPVWLYEERPKDYPDQMRVAVAIERAAAFQRWRTMVEAMEEELGLAMLDAAVREVIRDPAPSGPST